jgi:hypothetical protein
MSSLLHKLSGKLLVPLDVDVGLDESRFCVMANVLLAG